MIDPNPTSSVGKRRLLVAAGADAKREAVVETLERVGHAVDVVSDGPRAIEAIVRRTYDVVLIDIRLRSLDGLETVAAIRNLPGRMSQIPVVALLTEIVRDHSERFVVAQPDVDSPASSDYAEILATIDGLIGDTADAEIPSGESEGVLDPEVLAGIRQLALEDSTDVVGQVIGLFLDTTPPDMASLLDAIDTGDAAVVEAYSHKLKTSCANVGAMRLSNTLSDILILAQKGDLDGIVSRRQVLCAESDLAYRALEEML